MLMPFPRHLLTLLAVSVITASPGAADSAAPVVPPPADSHPATSAPAGSVTAPALNAEKPAASAPATTSAPTPEDEAVQAEIAARAIPQLKKLVSRQDALLAALGKDDADKENVKRNMQVLVFDYDDFIRTFPNYAPGYVTYGLLLGKVGMRRESTAILLKANQLDSNIPIVKNQLGNYLAEEGEPVEAANYYISATKLAPDEPLYHYQLGVLLTEGRDDFLKSGQWTREQLDRVMQQAFKRATELAPKNFAFAYRYAQSFYDLATPNWDEALKVWGELEDQVSPGLEMETIRLHAANILIKQKKFDHARMLLGTVTAEPLNAQKQKLLDQLPANPEK
jgi:tetratricopeptide (TPR) repeat protein